MVLTTSTEGPIVMQMVGSPSSDDLTCAVMPRLNRLINFDDSSWAEQLEADGFNSRHMKEMEDLLDSFFDTAHLEESLTRILKETKDITEGEELTNAIQTLVQPDSVGRHMAESMPIRIPGSHRRHGLYRQVHSGYFLQQHPTGTHQKSPG